MKLIYKDSLTPIIDNSNLNILSIESASTLYRFYYSLQEVRNGSGVDFTLSSGSTIKDFNKVCEWVPSIWNMDMNERRFLTSLYKQIKSDLIERDLEHGLIQRWLNLENDIHDFLLDYPSLDYDIEIPDSQQILKAFKIHFIELDGYTIVERIQNLIHHFTQYTEKNVFIFNNMISMFEGNNLEILSNFCQSEEVFVLLVEGVIDTKIIPPSTKLLIWDNDQCEILSRES